MNDRGEIAGEAIPTSGGVRRAAVWRAGVVSFLASTGVEADAQDINNLGQVVGRSWLGGLAHAVRWDPDGIPRDIGVSGFSSRAFGISDTGWVTGESFTALSPEDQCAVIYGPSIPMMSIAPSGRRSWGEDVNNNGVIVGTRVLPEEQRPPDYRGWVWDAAGGMRDVPFALSLRTFANAINNAGRIVGNVGNDAYVWDPVIGLIILNPAGWGEARDVNEAGTVVGRSNLGPFIWDMQRGLRSINDFLTAPINSDYPYALAINNRGQILLNAENWHSNPLPSRYYLLTPCYADCDGDGFLSLADFGCFQTRFVTNDPYADCNGDTVLNLADFGCFTTNYGLGCP